MNHMNGFNPLSRKAAHRRAMLRNMVTSLFRYERITTTKAKAQEVRRAAEKLITRAKFIADDKILYKLFNDIAPRMSKPTEDGKERKGGYTRILKLGFRQGDAADIVILELVDYQLPEEKESKNEKKAAAGGKE